MRKLICFLLLAVGTSGYADNGSDPLAAAVSGAQRDAKNVVRDGYRHPQETLSFFGIRPDLQVLEILPGGGWYTEILAPYLKDDGLLAVASFGAEHPSEYLRGIHIKMVEKFDGAPDIYGQVAMGLFQGEGYLDDFEDDSFDMALTFRNTHNWIRFGGIEEVFQAIYRVLKPGGILGVVQHRAAASSDAKASAEQGYVPEAYLIRLLEDTGFELVDKSEINANPKDTRDYPEGVWSLPPSYRLGDQDRDKYTEIGESDRMTMKFVKL